VVIALDDQGGGRGSGRSISAYDLHSGLSACAAHLTRFGGHRMAAGVELAAASVEPFRAALAAHAGAALAPEDLIPVERVDAVVPGGVLGLGLAEELEQLRPFGMGNPQPTLLVPAARFQNVTGMGEDKEHSRFTLVTAGGARSRGVAFGSPPKELAPAAEVNHDIALRLERNRWKGVVEPRTILRALCPTRTGELRVLGEGGEFRAELREALGSEASAPIAEAPALAAEAAAALAAAPHPAAAGAPGRSTPSPIDRRREGFAGVAGDLFTSGERVLVAVADVERRRQGLEQIVAGLAPDGMPVASWSEIAADPSLAAAHDHLVALDPPPGGATDPLLRQGIATQMAWGPAEAEFALQVYRCELDLRPALASVYRALRELPPGADAASLQQAIKGSGRYPRAPRVCAMLLAVLTELELVEFSADPPACRILDAPRTDLERSGTYRAAAERLGVIELALAAELPAQAPARAA
jgi:single-stranded-DNA-specific exonuclease